MGGREEEAGGREQRSGAAAGRGGRGGASCASPVRTPTPHSEGTCRSAKLTRTTQRAPAPPAARGRRRCSAVGAPAAAGAARPCTTRPCAARRAHPPVVVLAAQPLDLDRAIPDYHQRRVALALSSGSRGRRVWGASEWVRTWPAPKRGTDHGWTCDAAGPAQAQRGSKCTIPCRPLSRPPRSANGSGARRQ